MVSNMVAVIKLKIRMITFAVKIQQVYLTYLEQPVLLTIAVIEHFMSYFNHVA